MIEIFNRNCMDAMAEMKDKQFQLALVDPPYGIGENGDRNASRGKLAVAKDYKPFAGGDSEPPPIEYFTELQRVSINQIIFGANHFIDRIGRPSSCWIVWDKCREHQDFADCELAWTSFTSAVKQFTFAWDGFRQGDMKNKEVRIAPTQKPVKLYEWLLKNYAKPGDRILDTHLGSGSIAIACYNLGFSLTGFELDEEYYNAAVQRLEEHKKQGRLFPSPAQIRQGGEL